jgi:hopanoid C-3 methylase
MKILLVKPKPELLVPIRLQEGFLHLEPLELEIVAGGLGPEEEIKILDLGLEKNQFAAFEESIKRWRPQLIGFTGYSSNITTIKKLAKVAKSLDNRILNVVGGIHATLLPVDFAVPQIDIIVRGEGGLVLREIVKRFKTKEPLFFDNLSLSPEDPEFSVKAAMEPPQYPEIDKIPMPRRDLVQRERYFCVWTSSDTGKLESLFPQVASLRTSIGCAFSCSFCVIHHLMHRRYLQRTPEDVVNEIAALTEKYIYFLDDEMFLNDQRCLKIAELLLARGIKKEYVSWARSDTIVKHPEVFKLWKQAGLRTVYVGLESMDEERLLEYKKLLPVETNHKAIAILKEIGITLHAAFIVHPDFTEDDFKRLEKVVLSLCPSEIAFTVLSPSPGTTFWQENKQRFICDPYYYYDCMHTILPTRLPLKKFYRHFSRLTELALRFNPLRVNKIKVPFKDFIRAIVGGTKYIIALQLIYRDYLPSTVKDRHSDKRHSLNEESRAILRCCAPQDEAKTKHD